MGATTIETSCVRLKVAGGVWVARGSGRGLVFSLHACKMVFSFPERRWAGEDVAGVEPFASIKRCLGQWLRGDPPQCPRSHARHRKSD